ncbi:DUF262 domain-containing protein [Flavobacterium cyclinae]|uniref:DUF262 domain-containing protein n=1 Tax=Flavobacterium cyclinae TaxID=2895947 RepID=UPI001E290F7E|nr:DUF262 domain-containing protein [Flavobacterium cyclinae]UGS19882.1 DUF262 domain-containing HNH endonuclease family protein [Flavobacterium cyclinae]
MKNIKKLEDIFNANKIIVPPYQRAYAWEEKQLNQFINDLLDIDGKEYYYGHFIFEEGNDANYEVIDGQQRLTTFILFLMICGTYDISKNEKIKTLISKFDTVAYDSINFNLMKENIHYKEDNYDFTDFNIDNSDSNHTLSIERMLFALNFFKKGFKDEKLKTDNIDSYLNTLLNAHISVHSTKSKAVAVQIFELQNTRGINLSLLEKVKAKLMKAVYLELNDDSKIIIDRIQSEFSEIFKYEESLDNNNFRGDLHLDEILLYHLRIIDDGLKLEENNPDFWNPSTNNKEESILNYIDKKLTDNAVFYAENLVKKLSKTVKFLSQDITLLDRENRLIGDTIILSKFYSLELFILFFHKFENNYIDIFSNSKILTLWEKLLFTCDFHWKYHGKVYRNNFEALFSAVLSCVTIDEVEEKLQYYVNSGFRPELFEDRNLQKTVSEFIANHREDIINNAFHFFNGKMVYTLYKYEIEKFDNDQKVDLLKLREILKKGRSVEHILPQSWEWNWICADENNISEEERIFNAKIQKIINGIGNLLLISPTENSSLSNKHPKNKIYKSCNGGSYELHNQTLINWENYENWENNILDRGKLIYNFMNEYFDFKIKI